MRNWIVAGNWKMHNTLAEAQALATAVKEGSKNISDGSIILAPPYTALQAVKHAIKGSHVFLAAQNMHYEDKGAFTGEVSAAMLKDIGCSYVIIGHSERRKYFHEQNADVNLKIKKALANGLTPIVCVGETDEEREQGLTQNVVGRQVDHGLKGVSKIEGIVIAYEPVWAIGTGKVASPQQAQDVHAFIRKILRESYSKAAGGIRLLYGGSVTKDNIGDLYAMSDIDGALVGGASLKADAFLGIIAEITGKRKV